MNFDLDLLEEQEAGKAAPDHYGEDQDTADSDGGPAPIAHENGADADRSEEATVWGLPTYGGGIGLGEHWAFRQNDFKFMVELESHAQHRYAQALNEQGSTEGVLGTTLRISAPRMWLGETPSAQLVPTTFHDALNPIFAKIKAATVVSPQKGRRMNIMPTAQSEELPHLHELKESQEHCYAIGLFLTLILQGKLRPAAVEPLQALYDIFVRPVDGVWAALRGWLVNETLPRQKVMELRKRVDTALMTALEIIEAVELEIVKVNDWDDFCARWAPEPCENDWDRIRAAHAELVALVCPRAQAGSPDQQLSFEEHQRAERLWERVGGPSFPGRMMKTTVFTAVRMLMELRAGFTTPEFLEKYWKMRRLVRVGDPALVELALTIQTRVLPNYGFAGTVGGVNEMRNEIAVHNATDPVVWKVMKDIHLTLDVGQPLPKLPVITPLKASRFDVRDKTAWLRHLADEGYAVIAGAVTKGEAKTAYSLLWDFIERSDKGKKVKRRDTRTWQDGSEVGFGWPAQQDNGVIHGRGVGQCEALWRLRGLPAVKSVFAAIWGTEVLATSFDGACVFRPYGHNRDWATTKKHWLHVDQGVSKRGLHSVQGLVTLKDATPQTGGFVVVPGSHRFHNHILRSIAPEEKGDFNIVDPGNPILVDGDSRPRLICAEAADLIIWDSRTIHCNTHALVEDENLLRGNELMRAVCYICMTPAEWCPEDVIRKRARAFRKGVTTNHWPHEYHPTKQVGEWSPEFSLSAEQQELLCPQTLQGWSNASTSPAHKQGRVSLHPEQRYIVTVDQVQIWRTPAHDTTEKESTDSSTHAGMLKQGTEVRGYTFGRWLRLTTYPPEAVKFWSLDEAWVLMQEWDHDGNDWKSVLEPLDS